MKVKCIHLCIMLNIYIQTFIIKIEKFNNSRDDGQLKNMKALPLQLMIAEMLSTYVLHDMSVF